MYVNLRTFCHDIYKRIKFSASLGCYSQHKYLICKLFVPTKYSKIAENRLVILINVQPVQVRWISFNLAVMHLRKMYKRLAEARIVDMLGY